MYIDQIVKTTDALASLAVGIDQLNQENLPALPRLPRLTIACPGTYVDMGRFKSKPESKEEKFFRQAVQILRRQSTYAVHCDDGAIEELLSSPAVQAVVQWRAGELSAFTDGLAIRACSHLAPTIRLPPASPQLNDAITRFADCSRSHNKTHKLGRLFQAVLQQLSKLVPAKFLERFEVQQASLKLVADLPLEWLPIRGLPLGLRQTVSKVPATPGNLCMQNTVPSEDLAIPVEAFHDSLVIRCFREEDSLRTHLSDVIDVVFSGKKSPVKFVDVETPEEFVDAMREFRGAMAIFDGHGFHSKTTQLGHLVLPKGELDLWSLRKELKLPPIVFLCACDTQALDRSHSTAVNALLAAGAHTVIGTVLPVHSLSAATFVARLLLRVRSLLPGYRRPIRWDSVFSVMQRRVFLSELIRSIEARCMSDRRADVAAKASLAIELAGTKWYEEIRPDLASEFNIPEQEIDDTRDKLLGTSEALKYTQYGRPEEILVVPRGYGLSDRAPGS